MKHTSYLMMRLFTHLASHFIDSDLVQQYEMDRLDFAHAMTVRAIGNRLFLAPLNIEKTQNILDIETGTGICEHKAAIDASDTGC